MSDDVFVVDTILPALKVQNQKQAFQVLAEYAAQYTGLNEKKLFHRFINNERKSSSGIGNGVAIPHSSVRGLNKPYTLFVRLDGMIDYESLDDEPVDLICLILSPEEDGPYHLRRLARVSRILRDQNLCQCLRGSDNIDALQALLYDSSNHQIAA